VLTFEITLQGDLQGMQTLGVPLQSSSVGAVATCERRKWSASVPTTSNNATKNLCIVGTAKIVGVVFTS
jgi:hypothetical protein